MRAFYFKELWYLLILAVCLVGCSEKNDFDISGDVYYKDAHSITVPIDKENIEFENITFSKEKSGYIVNWDTRTTKIKFLMPEDGGYINSLSMSADKKYIAVGTEEISMTKLYLINLETTETWTVGDDAVDVVAAPAWGPSNELVFSYGAIASLKPALYNVERKKIQMFLSDDKSECFEFKWAKDGSFVDFGAFSESDSVKKITLSRYTVSDNKTVEFTELSIDEFKKWIVFDYEGK